MARVIDPRIGHLDQQGEAARSICADEMVRSGHEDISWRIFQTPSHDVVLKFRRGANDWHEETVPLNVLRGYEPVLRKTVRASIQKAFAPKRGSR